MKRGSMPFEEPFSQAKSSVCTGMSTIILLGKRTPLTTTGPIVLGSKITVKLVKSNYTYTGTGWDSNSDIDS
jgi:hypothetical protein